MTYSIDIKIMDLLKSGNVMSASVIIEKLKDVGSDTYISRRLKALADNRKIKLVQNSSMLKSRLYASAGNNSFISMPDYEMKISDFVHDFSLVEEPVTITLNRKPKGVYLPKDVYEKLCKDAGVNCVKG